MGNVADSEGFSFIVAAAFGSFIFIISFLIILNNTKNISDIILTS